ncbi:hypothetical protein GCM10022254_17730 [Actinomadura meridiana]|uniref:Uncharacterized protein n=1 Tax=Actinomadura meridiana TaxID=559626 RepID=A0ABP8BW71_9ACTN
MSPLIAMTPSPDANREVAAAAPDAHQARGAVMPPTGGFGFEPGRFAGRHEGVTNTFSD